MESILFVCVENAGRSLMAEAFMKKYAPNMRVASAGLHPADCSNEVVVQAMREVGIEIDKKPTALTSAMIQGGTRVINMGCIDSSQCPTILMHDAEDWNMPDPKDQPIEEIRRIRDMIEVRVREIAKQQN